MGLYLVQQLSSEIKLKYKAMPGTTIYASSPPSGAWSMITKGTLILNITLVRWKGVWAQGSDVRVGHGGGKVT